MKFAKELEDELVPEWRIKYFNYKQGKKKIKAVARALRNVQQTPRLGAFRRNVPESGPTSQIPYTHYDFTSNRPPTQDSIGAFIQNAVPPAQTRKPKPPRRMSSTVLMHTPPLPTAETRPLREEENGGLGGGQPQRNYGSNGVTPSQPVASLDPDMTPLRLPDPALSTARENDDGYQHPDQVRSSKKVTMRDPPTSSDAYHVGPTQAPQRATRSIPGRMFRSIGDASRRPPLPGATSTRSPLMRRMLSGGGGGIRTPPSPDVPLEAYRELDDRQDDFFSFLDKELDKIESFYGMKEGEASKRLHELRAQLHEMRDRRIEELHTAQKNSGPDKSILDDLGSLPNGNGNEQGPRLPKPLDALVSHKSSFGRTTQAMAQLGSPSKQRTEDGDSRRDYVKRHNPGQQVPYRSARRKLKMAMQEFYRGLELLKSYALVNRTAFRKINKKYDKAVNARPTGRYMAEKVNKAHFVKSETIESYIVAVEDLYARYFERGNHKLAVGKLRSKMSKSGDHSQTAFRNGVWLAAGAALGVQGMIYGIRHLHYHGNPAVRLQTSFLLQLYGGYFLGLLLFLTFLLDCRVWTRSKINYVFVFEFDSRHVLDWRQLAELPCFFLFLGGLFIWLNFRQGGEDAMFLYWPVVLVVVTLAVLCVPLPILYHRSRKWWAYANWRLLLAGLYPVEFRDFFLGDMYCSLTYSMGNIELFFCLYAQEWSSPPMCNSTHSRLLGFFAALPAVWRALQCIRRYYDSRNWFPHLANCGKYTFSILYYMSLSLYRVDKTYSLRCLFVFFAAINAVYCSVWDIAMDWSLGNPYSVHPFLRNTLGYRRVWIYYGAMVLDPLLRFTWIFYAILGNETQHSTLVSFLIALAEVVRRGVWAIFRVENEHCTNVGRFRASRDVPLPYSIENSPRDSHEQGSPATAPAVQSSTSVDLEQAASTTSTSLRLRRSKTSGEGTPMTRGLRRVGTIINQAHAHDFERRNRSGIVGDTAEHVSGHDQNDSSEDDDEENGASGEDEADAEEMLQARTVLDRAQA